MRLITNSIPLGANVHKNLLPVVRILIALSAVSYIIFILTGLNEKEWLIWKSALDTTLAGLLTLGAAFILMLINWGLEVAKWKFLSAKLQPQSWKTATYAVFYGISLGMITPKRSGEFAGRVYWLQPGNRLSGLLLNTAGSLSQLFITLFSGVAAVFIMLPQMQSHYMLVAPEMASPLWFLRAGITGGAIIAIGILFLLALSRVKNINKNSIRSKILNLLSIFSLLSPKDFVRLTGLSFLRYCTFSFQFYLLISLFGLQIPFFTAISLIAIVYLFMTLIPLSAIWELGVRGSVAVLVFGIYFTPSQSTVFEIPVLAATTLLWAINLGIPALAGGLLGLTTELNRNQIKG